ncbi:MAG: type II secretion system F family protein [Steroidobacteraceae bacterium]
MALSVVLLWPLIAGGVARWARSLQQSRATTLDRGFHDNFQFIEPRRFALVNLAIVLGAAGLALLVTRSGLLACGSGLAALAVPALWARRLRRRRQQRLRAQLPDALDLLAAGLQAGSGLLSALQQLATHQSAPLLDELQLLLRRQRLGVPLEQTIEQLRVRIPGSETDLLVMAIAVSRQLGGNLSLVLTRLAQTLRQKQAIERKIDALTAQGRLQARIVGLLPLVLMWVMLLMEPRAMHKMFETPAGLAVLGVLITLELSGFLLLRRVLRIDV